MSPGPAAFRDYAPCLVALSLTICFAVGWLMAALDRHDGAGPRRSRWLLGAALIGGAGAAISAIFTAPASPGFGEADAWTLAGPTIGAAALLSVGAALSMMVARRSTAQAQAQLTLLSTAMRHMPYGLLLIDAKGRVGFANRRFTTMVGLPDSDPPSGLSLDAVLDLIGAAAEWKPEHRASIVQGVAARLEHRTKDGLTLAVESQPVAGGGAIFSVRDVKEDRKAQSQITYMAFHDPVTNLPNRRAFQTRVQEAFPPQLRFKVMLIDLDRFKTINDTFGHAMGDRLLAEVATRLRSVMQAGDFIARIGGDEFATLVQGDETHALTVAGDVIAALAKPFPIDGLALMVGCSVGLCCTDDVEAAEELMTRADLALYEAKRSGRGRAFCYRPGMLEEVAERNLLEIDMRVALRQRQFHLVYQPIVSLHTGVVTGYEALIRWRHPSLGFVAPARFIPVAEESGQIVPIGRWVLEEACREATSWQQPLSIAVNLSPVQLRAPSVVADIVDVLQQTGLPAHRLEIELTETALMQESAALGAVLVELRALGIKVAMDDFGTGYSSLVNLRHCPLDRIKIDRRFVSTAERDPHSLAVLKAVMQIGRDLAIETLAEGVETDQELQILRSMGCDSAQGHHIGRPDPLPNETRIGFSAASSIRLARAS